MKEYTYIIWDWNGTLLDDVAVSVKINSDMLVKRGLPPITKEDYLDIIEIPLVNYYRKLFDLRKDPFDKLSVEFIEQYEKEMANMQLMSGAREMLETLKNKGYKQIILSSFEENILKTLVNKFDLLEYFDFIIGRDDFRSESKTSSALKWIDENKINASKVIVIGDLIHDYEMSKAIKADCLLIANGHQNKSTLLKEGVKVLEDIKEITDYIT